MKKIIFAVLVFSFANIGWASEYCLDRYDGPIRQVNVELSDKLNRLNALQDVLRNVQEDKNKASMEMAKIIREDPGLTVPANRERMVHLGKLYDGYDRIEADSKSETYQIQDRIVMLKTVIPATLAGELRGCVEAVKPTNTLVNTVIQAIAILSTGGAALALPPKALYVDMGAVLNGYPLGGPSSVVNQARESVLNALGLGGANNTAGQIIRDPGRVIRCLFGC